MQAQAFGKLLELVQGITTGSLNVKVSSRYHEKREVSVSAWMMTDARCENKHSKFEVVKWIKTWIQVYTRNAHTSMYTYHSDVYETTCYRNLKDMHLYVGSQTNVIPRDCQKFTLKRLEIVWIRQLMQHL
jgi:hypothetical protein